jgi:SAM-dependent methyltransferase
MKPFPNTKHSFSRIFEMNQGIFYSKLLHEAIVLGLFNHLEQEALPSEVARKLQLHPGNTGYFLDGLVSIGLVEKKEGKYKNSGISQEYLIKGTETYLGDFMLYHDQWNTPLLENFGQVLRDGPPDQDKGAGDEEIWAQGAYAMVNYQRTCSGPAISGIISDLPESLSFRRMLDLGGGTGLNSLAILSSLPDLRGTLFDRSAVLGVAREYIREYKMEERLAVMEGDFMTDPLGDGYDLILASACLNFAKEEMVPMVEKIHNALNPGGLFVSIHDGLTHERTRPEPIVLSMLPVSMVWQDLGLDRGVIAGAMVKAGFKTVSSRSVSYGLGAMDLDIGRKE